MSSSPQNDEIKALGLVFAIIGGVLSVMVLLAFVAGIFFCLVLSVICLFAWNKPVKLGKETLTPEAARAFVKRGLHGAYLLPLFCIFLELFFNIQINVAYLPHIILIGYVIGSLGVELLYVEQALSAAETQTLMLPSQRIAAAAPELPSQPAAVSHKAPASEAAPFRYASWDDEVGPSDLKPKNCNACAFLPAQVIRPPR